MSEWKKHSVPSPGFPLSGPPPRRSACAAFGALFVIFLCGPTWADTPELLDATDRELLARLGPDIKRTPPAAIDPASLIEAFTRAQNWPFRMIEGPKQGQRTEISIHPRSQLPGSDEPSETPLWAFEIPGVITQYAVAAEEGLHSSLILLQEGPLTLSYIPPDPVLLRGVGHGESKTYEMDVEVHPVSDLKDTRFTGRIRATYMNKGSYRFETPSRTFDGVIIATEYKGKVGPVSVNDRDLRIYSPEVGLVAMVVHDRLHALFLIRENKFLTLLRADPVPTAK